jgi:hypothetical protein
VLIAMANVVISLYYYLLVVGPSTCSSLKPNCGFSCAA